MSEEELVEAGARALCEEDGRDPNALEPGDDPYMDNTICIDGYNRKGEPCHFFWRHYAYKARAIIPIVKEADARIAEAKYRDHQPISVRAANYRHAARRIAAAIRGEA